MAATVTVLSCCQGLPGSGEQWSAPLPATERDRKSEVEKAGIGAASGRSPKDSGEQHYKQIVLNIWLVTYWMYGKYFPGWSYKNTWEYTMMGGILISLSSFSSLKQREPMRKDCRSSLCHPAGSSAQVHNCWLNPITLLSDLYGLNEAHQKMEASKGPWQGQIWKEATAGSWTLFVSAW